MNFLAQSHRRYNPLTDEWVLVSPHRLARPWQGQIETPPREILPAYDPSCYLCPGNARAGGARNPRYEHTFVFDNDFAALTLSSTALANEAGWGLLCATSERGICRVICFSPRHDFTLPAMAVPEIRRVVEVWAEQSRELGARDFVNYVQVFENKGAAMGASNPHPHCQVWATEHIPTAPAKELQMLSAFHTEHRACLLCEYLALELAHGERIVLQNEHFVALVPFWAVWPFEILLLARRHTYALPDLNDTERDALAEIVKRLTTGYDKLFDVSFPYSMGFHQSLGASAMHLHAHYDPPLLRSATIRKFMVGYELLAEPQRDLTPELAAARLREMDE